MYKIGQRFVFKNTTYMLCAFNTLSRCVGLMDVSSGIPWNYGAKVKNETSITLDELRDIMGSYYFKEFTGPNYPPINEGSVSVIIGGVGLMFLKNGTVCYDSTGHTVTSMTTCQLSKLDVQRIRSVWNTKQELLRGHNVAVTGLQIACMKFTDGHLVEFFKIYDSVYTDNCQ